MKLGGGVFRHTKQHVSDVTDGPDTTVWHRRMLEMVPAEAPTKARCAV